MFYDNMYGRIHIRLLEYVNIGKRAEQEKARMGRNVMVVASRLEGRGGISLECGGLPHLFRKLEIVVDLHDYLLWCSKYHPP